MLSAILLLIGALLVGIAVTLYIRECRGPVSPGMGAEMTFSSLFGLGVVLVFLGGLPLLHLSRWWTLVGAPACYAASFYLRSAMVRKLCRPYVPEPTGYQRFARRVEGTKNDGAKTRGCP